MRVSAVIRIRDGLDADDDRRAFGDRAVGDFGPQSVGDAGFHDDLDSGFPSFSVQTWGSVVREPGLGAVRRAPAAAAGDEGFDDRLLALVRLADGRGDLRIETQRGVGNHQHVLLVDDGDVHGGGHAGAQREVVVVDVQLGAVGDDAGGCQRRCYWTHRPRRLLFAEPNATFLTVAV